MIDDKTAKVWKRPTRRAFVAMLGLGAAALAVTNIDRERRSGSVGETAAPRLPTRWIGHC